MRRVALIVAAVVLVLAVVVVLFAAPALRLGLDLAGLEDLRYRELRLGVAETELVGVAYGEITAERVRIAHPPTGLARLRAAEVHITGAVIPAVADGEGVRVSGLDPAPGDAPRRIPALPFDRLELTDSRIELATPWGMLDLPVAADVLAGERLEVAFRAVHGRMRGQPEALTLAAEGTADLPLDRPPGADNVTLEVGLRADTDNLDLDGLVRELAGWAEATIEGAAGRWTLEVPTVRLEASALLPDDPPIRGAVRVRGTGDGTPVRLALRPGADGTGIEGAFNLIVLAPGLVSSATLAGSGHLHPDGLPDLRALELEGTLRTELDDLVLPRVDLALDGDLDLAIATREGIVEALATGSLTLADLPAELEALVGAPLTLGLGEGEEPLAARLDPGGLLSLDGPLAVDAPRLRASGPVELAGELGPLLDWAGDGLPPVDLRARLDVAARDLAGADLAGPIEIELRNGALEAEVRAATLTLPPLDLVPDERVVLTLGTEQPLHVTLGADREVLARGPLRASGVGDIDATLDLALMLDESFRPLELRPSTMELDLAGLDLAGLSIGGGSMRVRLAGPADALAFEAAARLQAAEMRHEATMLRGDADLDLAGRIAEGTLELTLPQPQHLTLADASLDGARLEGPIALDVTVDAPLSHNLENPDALPAGGPLRIAPQPASLRYVGGDAPVRIGGQLPSIVVEPLGDRLRLSLDGGEVRLPDAGIVLEDLGAALEVDRGGAIADEPVPVRVATIRSEASPAAFAPLSLDGTLAPREDVVDLDVRVRDASGHLDARLAGSHRIAEGRGQAQLTVTPLELGPGGVTPGSLAPALAGVLLAPSGTVAAEGTLGWGPGGLTPAIDVALRDLSFTSGPARIERVNGVVRLDGLAPPSTPPGQHLAIAMLDIGLPFTDGLVDFELREDGLIDVSRLTWRWAGGEVRAQPFSFRSVEEPFTVVLETDNLQLDDLLAEIQLDGLRGQGVMAGRLPVRVEGNVAVIEGGELAAVGPGWVRYRPERVPAGLAGGGGGVELMLQAAENFQYEVLRLRLDGRTDGEMDIGLQLHGANPDLYDGHPVQFNVNVEGELANIIRRSLEGYTMPDVVRERLERFGR